VLAHTKYGACKFYETLQNVDGCHSYLQEGGRFSAIWLKLTLVGTMENTREFPLARGESQGYPWSSLIKSLALARATMSLALAWIKGEQGLYEGLQ